MKSKNGFTIIELMITIALIAIIVAIAFMNLIRSRIDRNEQSAVERLHHVYVAQEAFAGRNGGVYATSFEALATSQPPLLPGNWRVSMQGYKFMMGEEAEGGYTVLAIPDIPGRTGSSYYFLDQTGTIRENKAGGSVNAESPPVVLPVN